MIASAYKKMQKIIVIVGPTAIGKTSLSIDIAKALDTEVVSADSRQVYKGLDLGSGKVTKEEMDGIPHHLLDVADPKDVFTASDYKKLGEQALNKILSKEKVPVVIGGTGFYIDTLLDRVSLPKVPPNEELRNSLEAHSLEELQEKLKELDPEALKRIDIHNPRRLIRAIEIAQALGKVPEIKEAKSPYEVLWIGLEMPIPELRKRVRERLLSRLEEGMLEEAKELHDNGLLYERMDQLGLEYRYMAKHLKGEISYDEMLESLEKEVVKYARRQMTWFKKNKEIHWFQPNEGESAIALAKEFLTK